MQLGISGVLTGTNEIWARACSDISSNWIDAIPFVLQPCKTPQVQYLVDHYQSAGSTHIEARSKRYFCIEERTNQLTEAEPTLSTKQLAKKFTRHHLALARKRPLSIGSVWTWGSLSHSTFPFSEITTKALSKD